MSDWQVGDLALCVDESNPAVPSLGPAVREGRVYTVKAVTRYRRWQRGSYDVGLILLEARHYTNRDGDFVANIFRKIIPDAPEPCEAEFVTLLKRNKVRA